MSEFFFAWVAPTETDFGSAHEREDEEIFSLEISHQEGDWPQASVTIANPKVGLLGPGREVWAWIAWNSGGSDGAVPLFFGRLVGVPDDVEGEDVTLQFVARPTDYDEQWRALAETLKAAPYWDPVWIPDESRDDPDAVLEARSALRHIDRITHEVTVSDMIAGEDGTIDLGGDYDYDSLSVSLGQTPARRVRVTAEAAWDQAAVGTVDLTAALLAAAKAVDSGSGKTIDSYTGDGLASDWPEEGDRIGAGWTFGTSGIRRGDGLWIPATTQRAVLQNSSIAEFPSWSFRPVLQVDYDASRSRKETVSFTLEADVQSILTEPGDEEEIQISLSSDELGQPIDNPDDSDGGTAPIGDARRRSYFQTDRGRQSLGYLIALARARLLARARAVDISLVTSWENGLALSCRKNLLIEDDRLPGGQAAGKITGYSLRVDGSSGVMECEIAIGCCIGKGNAVSESAGTPDYVEDGYVEDGYQTRAGAVIMPIAGEVTYEDFASIQPVDDGVDFFAMTPAHVVTTLEIQDGKDVQRSVLEGFWPDLAAAIEALNAVSTQIFLELVPLNSGPFETAYPITVSNLMVPKTIDLEAA